MKEFSKASYQPFPPVGIRPAQYQKSNGGMSYLATINTRIETNTNVPPTAQKTDILRHLSAWLQLEIAEGDASPHTLCSYLSSTKAYLAWCTSESIDAIHATNNDLKLFRAHLVNQGYRRGTIATKFSGVRCFYNAVLAWGWRQDNPAEGIKTKRDLTSRAEKVIEKYISDRDAFLNMYQLPDNDSPLGLRDRALLRILCYTGIRVSELCGINLGDLNLGEMSQLAVRAGKGRKSRHIPLGEEDVSILRAWMEVRQSIIVTENRALFIALDNHSKGQRLSTRGARKIVDKYLRLVGLKQPGRSCHALRHSNATWLLAAGVPIEAIADLLGHSSVAMTAIYAKVVDHRKYTPSAMLTQSLGEPHELYTLRSI